MNQSKLPYGWNETYIKRVLDHYEEQTEDGSTFKVHRQTIMAIPKELGRKLENSLPDIRTGKVNA